MPSLKNIKCFCEYCGKEFYTSAKEIRKGWGKFCSVQCANTVRALGERNPNYLGGRAYKWVRLSKKYRREIRKRDGNQCVCCGAKNVRLDVHHIVPIREGGSDDPDNLTTLCQKCHNRIEYGRLIAS